jgi:hypothetical protein
MRRVSSISATFLLVSACGSGSGVDGAASQDAFAPDASTIDAYRFAPDAYFPVDAVSCADGGFAVADSLRTCTTDDDCAMVIDWLDASGSFAAHGVRGDLAPTLGALCGNQPPQHYSGSFSYSVTGDDGRTVQGGGVSLACVGGLCTTSVSAPANCGVWNCLPTQYCMARCAAGDAGIMLEERCRPLPAGCNDPSDCACISAADPCVMCWSGSPGPPYCPNMNRQGCYF